MVKAAIPLVVAIVAAASALGSSAAHAGGSSARLGVRVVVLPRPDPRLYEPMPAATASSERLPRLGLARSLSWKPPIARPDGRVVRAMARRVMPRFEDALPRL